MNGEYKFKIGETVLIVNTDGPTNRHYSGIGKYIGTHAEVIGLREGLSNVKRYRLNITSNGWYFYEFNLEAIDKGFDAEDIIKKAFNLGG